MKKIIFIIIFIIFLFIVNSAFAQSKILINEFLIDPQPQSVELFNSGTESADLSDWIIDDSGGATSYTIPKNSVIFPNQCLIFSSDFNLNKTSADTVRLINNSQQLIDFFSYKSSSGSGVSYFRLPDGADAWTTGSANLGFYNQTNTSCLVTPTPTPISEPTLTITPTITIAPTITLIPTETPTPTLQSYDNVYLNEAMVNPPAGEKEWVEIYNDNDSSVSLINWYLDDLENAGSSSKIFSLDILPKGYAVFELSSTMFNNTGDSVRLLDFNKNLKDSFEYSSSVQGETYGRTSLESDDFCVQEPSKNSANNPCIYPTGQAYLTPTTNIIPTKTSITKPNNLDVSTLPAGRQVHRSINYPTGTVVKNYDNGDVLGISSAISNSNSLLIRCLTFVSFSYSFLVIVSILIKIKVLKKYVLAG